MTDRPADRSLAIARLLFATHLPFLLLCWVVFTAAVLALTFAIDLRTTITRSVWDPAVTVVRWFALGYGLHLVNRLLPMYVAHGRTRREFLRSAALFLTVAAAVLAALLTLGFALEAVLYRAMDWTHQVSAERLFDDAGQWPLVFGSYWAMLLIWTTIGLLLAAGFYRSEGNALVAIVLALAIVAVTEIAFGFNGLDFIGDLLDVDRPSSLAGSVALCLGGLLTGAGAVWAMVRDIAIRNRAAP